MKGGQSIFFFANVKRPHLKKGHGDASEKALEMQASNFLKKREYQDFLVEGV